MQVRGISIHLATHCPGRYIALPPLVYPENIYTLGTRRHVLNGPFCGCHVSPFQPAYVLALQASENWDKFLELEKYLRCHVPIKFKSVSLTKHCPNLASTHPSLVYPENIYILHAHRAAARCILNGPFCGCRPFSRYRYPFWHSRIHKIGTNSQS